LFSCMLSCKAKCHYIFSGFHRNKCQIVTISVATPCRPVSGYQNITQTISHNSTSTSLFVYTWLFSSSPTMIQSNQIS
jgi:hypothetical protein